MASSTVGFSFPLSSGTSDVSVLTTSFWTVSLFVVSSFFDSWTSATGAKGTSASAIGGASDWVAVLPSILELFKTLEGGSMWIAKSGL